MVHFMLKFKDSRAFQWSVRIALLMVAIWLLPAPTWPLAHAEGQALPNVSYPVVNPRTGLNEIGIGGVSVAPAVDVITIPELATALAAIGHGDKLVDQGGGNWLLRASVLVTGTARLEIKAPEVTTLRLLSTAGPLKQIDEKRSHPTAAVVMTAYQYGHILFDGVAVTSWDPTVNGPDMNLEDGRSYLLAWKAGRLDILNSDVSYLGWTAGEQSGLAWRQWINKADTNSWATGNILDSRVHHNYFGMYSYEAYGLNILRNEFDNNIYYGIDPHDFSENFEVAYNIVHDNGNHGIIFSRECINNRIHHNTVYNNLHGIMMDRGTDHNHIYENIVYGNSDGVAIFQSSNNIVENNHIYQNQRGVRINASFMPGDRYDGISAENVIRNNLIEDNSEHGIYLYTRADRNIITGNTILRSGVNGIYMRTGGNTISNNIIRDGGNGINIVGGDVMPTYEPQPDWKYKEPLPSLYPITNEPVLPGDDNKIFSNTISSNADSGIRLLGGRSNQIGQVGQGNRIEQNGRDGIAIGDAATGGVATDNKIEGNTIRQNVRHGITISDLTSMRNTISRNSITKNGQLGIKVAAGAQGGILPPSSSILGPNLIGGISVPNATIEVYSDSGNSTQLVVDTVVFASSDDPNLVTAAGINATEQITALNDLEGEIYVGTVSADNAGNWTFQVPVGYDSKFMTLIATDSQGNSTAFGSAEAGTNPLANYEIVPDPDRGLPRIQVTAPGYEVVVTMNDILTGLGSENNGALVKVPGQDGVWLLNLNLFIGPNVVLNLSPNAGVKELRLRSNPSGAPNNPTGVDIYKEVDLETGEEKPYDYASFVYIRTHNGSILIDGVKITSWNTVSGGPDTDYSNGRAYLLAKYDAEMNIRNADIGFLGSPDGESYGLAWRDNNGTNPDGSESTILRTRVSGDVINSKIHDNYFGIYTYQAGNMVFRGNELYNNARYGFDPHDFTHTVLVEDNISYNNGSHGFIISRGCNNFIIRNNTAYGNRNKDPESTSRAHGFMLDPGSPNSRYPQAPSYENLLENNIAYNNEGYGLRVLGSVDNQILRNRFYQNTWGMSLEGANIGEGAVLMPLATTGNMVSNNEFTNNSEYGIYIREWAEENTIEHNTISGNKSHGIYLRGNNNVILGNTVRQNGDAGQGHGIAVTAASVAVSTMGNQLISNTIASNVRQGIDIRRAQQTLVQGNLVENHLSHAIQLSDFAVRNMLVQNTIRNNEGFGIRASGAQTINNTWSQNTIYNNRDGGIALVDSANFNVAPPTLLSVVGKTVSGQAQPGQTIEIFADLGAQGQHFIGQTVAELDGSFGLIFSGNWPASNLTAIAIDGAGNASAFGPSIPSTEPTTPTPTPTGTPATPTPTTTPATPTPTPTQLPGGQTDTRVFLPLIRN